MSAVEITKANGVATLVLNEPDTLNALSPAIRDVLESAIPAMNADPEVGCFLITGRGRGFCAGGDIRGMDDRASTAVHARMQRHFTWVKVLLLSPKPVVTAINGIAAGAGVSLALMGDIVVASRDATFRTSFSRLGTVPDLGLAYTLPRAIGYLRAKDMLLTNRTVDATEGLTMGLVSRVAEPAALMSTAEEIARSLADGPRLSLGLTKGLLDRGATSTLEAFLEREALSQALAYGSDDFTEGVAAFRAKRKPKFR